MTDVVSRGPGAEASSEDRIIAGLNYALLFATPFFAGLTAVIAIVLAYVRRPLSDPLTRTHYAFQMRIFWIGLIVFVLSVVVAIVGLFMAFGVIGPENARGVGDFFTISDGGASASSHVGHFNVAGVILLTICAAALFFDLLWVMLASVFGLARLLSSEPIGRPR
jgi:uncharacterized membrane protein